MPWASVRRHREHELQKILASHVFHIFPHPSCDLDWSSDRFAAFLHRLQLLYQAYWLAGRKQPQMLNRVTKCNLLLISQLLPQHYRISYANSTLCHLRCVCKPHQIYQISHNICSRHSLTPTTTADLFSLFILF